MMDGVLMSDKNATVLAVASGRLEVRRSISVKSIKKTNTEMNKMICKIALRKIQAK